jgi:hypothetical protein
MTTIKYTSSPALTSKGGIMKRIIFLIILLMSSAALSVDLKDTVKAVGVLSPRLSKERAIQYSLGAVVAGNHYQVDPMLLIAIAFQESSLREKLPEGPAGERGICQVLKSWATNNKFRKEFGVVRDSDFDVASNNFKFAAWILHQNNHQYASRTELPAWTFYNAQARAARARYYAKVSYHLARVNREPASGNVLKDYQ